METEELKELFRKHNIGFEDICRFWITTYPEDIFSEKNPVGKITRLMKKILEQEEKRYACGHKPKPVIIDNNPLSISAYLEWYEKPEPKPCFECWCKKKRSVARNEGK